MASHTRHRRVYFCIIYFWLIPFLTSSYLHFTVTISIHTRFFFWFSVPPATPHLSSPETPYVIYLFSFFFFNFSIYESFHVWIVVQSSKQKWQSIITFQERYPFQISYGRKNVIVIIVGHFIGAHRQQLFRQFITNGLKKTCTRTHDCRSFLLLSHSLPRSFRLNGGFALFSFIILFPAVFHPPSTISQWSNNIQQQWHEKGWWFEKWSLIWNIWNLWSEM